MQRDVEKVEELYYAFQKGDLKSVLMLMSKDIEIIQSPELPWGGHHMGTEGVKKFVSALNEHIDTRLEVERLIDSGDTVVAVGRTIGKARSTKLEFEIPFVHVWTFHEGLITRFEPYIENGTMLAALGA